MKRSNKTTDETEKLKKEHKCKKKDSISLN